jgi:hypothetical protein
LAIFAAIRRASSFVSNLPAEAGWAVLVVYRFTMGIGRDIGAVVGGKLDALLKVSALLFFCRWEAA